MPTFVSIESPKLGSAVQLNNGDNTTVVSVENSTFGSVAQVNKNEIVNVYHLSNTDIQSYYNEKSRQNAEDAQTAQLAAEVAQSAAETAETNAKASELDAEAAQAAAETAQSKAETAQSLSEAARDASQTAQSLSETAQAGAELAESNAKASELDAEAAQIAAETAQSKAETAQSLSETAQAGAELAQAKAETAETNAETAQAAAELAESNAKASELDAESAATGAETAQSLAETAQAGAELAETNAETAQSLSEAAQAAAEIAETNAEIAEVGSISARDESVTAQLAAEAARDAAQTARTGAETAESNAQASASGATSAKVAAQAAQANAETAQSAAETAEANAQASASSAAANASSAATDADRAERAAETAVNTLSAKGDWDASQGVYPTPTPNSADFYQISVAGTMSGTQGSMEASVGDQLYWHVDKSVWYKIDNTDHILSVNGKEGAVVLDHTDVGALGAIQNAVSASKWQSARTLTLAGDATGAASIDGSSNVTLTVDVANDSHTHDGRYHTKTEADSRFANVSGDIFNGNVAISKGAAKLVLTESDYSTNNSGIDFKTATANQNLELIHEISDSKINTTGGNGQALIVRQTSGSAQAGLEVEGEIFARANQRVFHDAYHPNADSLTTARTINGTSFNGTGNITTANWGTARTFTIGNTARSVDGASNVSWTVAEIGAAPRSYGLGEYGRSLPSSILGNTALRRESGFWQGSSVTGLPTYGHTWKYLWTQAHSNAAGYWGYIGVDFDCTAAFFGGQSAGVDKTAIRLFADNYHPNADKWTTARTLTLAGDLSGSVSIDGSSNVTLSAAVSDDSHLHTYIRVNDTRAASVYPNDLPDRSVSAQFTNLNRPGGFGSWYSALSVNGWNDGYQAWQLLGGSNSSADNELYFRRGVSTAWDSTQRIFMDDYHPNADKWTTARTLTLSGDVSGSVSIDGSANVTMTTTVADNSHNHTNLRPKNQNWNTQTDDFVTGSSSSVAGAPTTSFINWIQWGHNGGSKYRHSLYSFADGSAMSQLWYGYKSNTSDTTSNATGQRIFMENYHPNADKWTTARTLSLSGDASGSVSWDGSANATLSVTVANDSHTHDGRYYTESESNSRFAQNSEFSTTQTFAGIINKYLSKVTASGVLEVARYIDFHTTNSTADYDIRLDCNSSGNLTVSGGTLTASTFIGALNGNASTATWADTVDVNTSASTSFYGLVWHSGDTLYASENQGLTVRPSDGFTKIKHGYLGNERVQFDTSGKIIAHNTAARRAGMYGVYDSNKIGHIWSMGTSYMIDDSGATFGNLYGLAYKHTNNTTGGTMAGGHQAVWCVNGVGKSAIGDGGIWTSGKVTGGTFSATPITTSNTQVSYTLTQGAGVYVVMWEKTGSNYQTTILMWDGSSPVRNGDYGDGLVPFINASGVISSLASTAWKPKRIAKIG